MQDNPCCQSLIQTFLIVFNCISFVASGAVLGFSIYILAHDGFNRSMLPEDLPDTVIDFLFDQQGETFQLPVKILCLVSAFILVVSLLGCVGSCQQSRCLVSLYFIFVTGFLVILVGGTAYCFLGDPQKPIRTSLKASLMNYREDNFTRHFWYNLQTKLFCCGAESIDDWKDLDWDCLAPNSCIVDEDIGDLETEAEELRSLDNSTETVTTDSYGEIYEGSEDECLKDLRIPHYNEGCLLKLNEYFRKYINIVGAIMVSVWVIVLLNVLFSFALCVVLDYAEYTYK